MSEEMVFSKFIRKGEFNDDSIKALKKKLLITEPALIRKTFKLLNEEIAYLNKELDYKYTVLNCIDFLSLICNEKEFSEEDVVINRRRIKKSREALLALSNKLHDEELLYAANRLDEIILDKGINLKDLIKLLKKLIDKKEEFNIIKKLLNTNKGVLIMEKNELFEYTFKKTLDALITDSTDIYYYIALLKIFYSSKINTKKYVERLDAVSNDTNEYANEIYYILHGHKRELTADQVLDKYGILTEFQSINIQTPDNYCTNNELILTIDSEGTKVRDDAISLKMDGNKYIVGIHISDPASFVEPKSVIDYQAMNNFSCTYLPETVTRIFPTSIEEKLTLDKGTYKNVISMYVIIDNCGNLLNYYIIKDIIKIDENLTFNECDQLLINNSELSRKLNQLYELSIILEEKNKKKYLYWDKKDAASLDKIVEEHRSNKIISELMVLYNHLMAVKTYEKNIPYVYRTQSNTYLYNLIEKLNIQIDDEAKKIIDNIYLKSKYSFIPVFHNGLNLPKYSHSTSALRRYPDLYNQYLLHKFYFHDLDMKFNYEEHKKLIDYFNQRSIDLSLMSAEYTRALRQE